MSRDLIQEFNNDEQRFRDEQKRKAIRDRSKGQFIPRIPIGHVCFCTGACKEPGYQGPCAPKPSPNWSAP
jgi:hypothetical protein